MVTLWTVFLSLHAASGVLGLLLGGFAFHPPQPRDFRQWVRRVYAAALVSMSVFLVATVLVDWSSINSTQHVVYSALIGLAAVILARLYLAFRVIARQPTDWIAKYVNHIYFTYVSLWEAFFIVGLIDLGAPAWVVGAVAVGVLILGATLVSRYKGRLQSQPVGNQQQLELG